MSQAPTYIITLTIFIQFVDLRYYHHFILLNSYLIRFKSQNHI